MRGLLGWLADLILGERCPLTGCDERVFPKDLQDHHKRRHSGWAL